MSNTAPACTTCRRTKAPRGRSVSPAQHGSLCDRDCPGYAADPQASESWPAEPSADPCCIDGCKARATWSVWPDNAVRPDYLEPLVCDAHLPDSLTHLVGDPEPRSWTVRKWTRQDGESFTLA